MSIKVLMLGPGEGTIGGIRSLAEAIVPALQRRIDLEYMPTVRCRAANESGKLSVGNLARALSQYTRFVMVLARFRPQVVHIHSSEGLAWLKDTFYLSVSKMWGCKVVLHMHGGDFVKRFDHSCSMARRYTRFALDLADDVIEVSDSRARELARITPKARISVLRNCVDVPELPAPVPHNNTAAMRALFLGTVGFSKGVYGLLEAAWVANSAGSVVELVLAGPPEHGDEIQKIRSRVQGLGLSGRCCLIGAVYGCDKSRLMQTCDVLALPSYREAMPMAILEAMAAGLPVVATDVGGVSEIVVDGYNGFLVAPGDVEALAHRLIFLAAQPELRRKMGQRGREIVQQQFDVTSYVERLVALYESVVEDKRTSGRQVPA